MKKAKIAIGLTSVLIVTAALRVKTKLLLTHTLRYSMLVRQHTTFKEQP